MDMGKDARDAARMIETARARFFVALGLPSALVACVSASRSVQPTPPRPPEETTVAPVQADAGAPLRCGADQLRDMACVDAKGACAQQLANVLTASIVRTNGDTTSNLTLDPVLTTETAQSVGRAVCCYVRCTKLVVASKASLASPGFKTRCVSMPDAESSVPARGAPNCPAAAELPGQSGLIPFDKTMHPESTPGVPDTWKSARCCYLDDKDYPTGVGRPLVVLGRRCLPADVPLSLEHMSDRRRRVARHWHAVARGEHASVSAFETLALDLQHHGAPPKLLREASHAALDEAVHATLAYDHVSRLVGQRVGPGDLAPAWQPKTLAELAVDTFAHGCFEETLGALIAEELASVATTDDLRRTLRRIARDELRHAELAFRILAFCLDRDPQILRHLERTLADVVRSIPELSGEPSADLEGDGVPSGESLRAVARSICDEILAPSLRALSARSALTRGSSALRA